MPVIFGVDAASRCDPRIPRWLLPALVPLAGLGCASPLSPTLVEIGRYPTGRGPAALAVADLDGDGRLDAAVANEMSGDVSIFLGQRAGRFSEAAGSPFAAGPNPNDLAVVDSLFALDRFNPYVLVLGLAGCPRFPLSGSQNVRSSLATSSLGGIMHRIAACCILFAAANLVPEAAHAWGDKGHQLVCEMAFQELAGSPTQAEVRRLIALDPEYSTFSESCTWPDHPRKRAIEHYINLPRHYTYIATADCRLASQCLFSAIAQDVHEISLDSTSDARKLELLKFLGHWIGDIHQPLHVSFKDDKGGGRIHETGDVCPGDIDLHSVWDTCLVTKVIGGRSIRDTATALLAEITDLERLEWSESTRKDWAEESLLISLEPGVGYCTRKAGSCWYDAGNKYLDPGEPERAMIIDAPYVASNEPIVRERLKQAAMRLTGLLETVFDPQPVIE